MKSNLDHLPTVQQDELERITGLLLRGFDAAIAGGTQTWRRNGKILKIILFGSYARGDFVDEPQNGYLSDFDLLVVVSHDKLTDIADYWWETEQKILHDPTIGRIVNLIVHDLDDVNQALSKGQYFFSEIVRDGVALYEAPGHSFAPARSPTTAEALAMAEDYFVEKAGDLSLWLETSADHIAKASTDGRRAKRAAFELHQAVETAYICVLLVKTLYFPRSHNIKFLRSLAEDTDKRLLNAWPRGERADRRLFEKLKRAYVDARYNQYEISLDELTWLYARADALGVLVNTICVAHLDQLRRKAEANPAQ